MRRQKVVCRKYHISKLFITGLRKRDEKEYDRKIIMK